MLVELCRNTSATLHPRPSEETRLGQGRRHGEAARALETFGTLRFPEAGWVEDLAQGWVG